METPAVSALRLPELLTIIFGHLKRANLARTVLVNRIWAQRCISFLWRHPPGEALEFVPVARRPMYDPSIRHLDVRKWLQLPNATAWSLPHLRAITGTYHCKDVAQAQLAAALKLPHSRGWTHLVLSPAQAHKHYTRSPECQCNTGPGSETLLFDIADACRQLVTLEHEDAVTLGAVRRGCSLLLSHRRVTVVVEVAAVASFCALIPRAEELCIDVPMGGRTNLLAVAATRMPSLRMLSVSCGDPLDLVCFQPGPNDCVNSQLQEVRLVESRIRFTRDSLSRFRSLVPHVRVLQLPDMGNSLIEAVRTIAQRCPQIIHLKFAGEFCPLHWQGFIEEVLLSHLESLECDDFSLSGTLNL